MLTLLDGVPDKGMHQPKMWARASSLVQGIARGDTCPRLSGQAQLNKFSSAGWENPVTEPEDDENDPTFESCPPN